MRHWNESESVSLYGRVRVRSKGDKGNKNTPIGLTVSPAAVHPRWPAECIFLIYLVALDEKWVCILREKIDICHWIERSAWVEIGFQYEHRPRASRWRQDVLRGGPTSHYPILVLTTCSFFFSSSASPASLLQRMDESFGNTDDWPVSPGRPKKLEWNHSVGGGIRWISIGCKRGSECQ